LAAGAGPIRYDQRLMPSPPQLMLVETAVHGRVLVRSGTSRHLLIGFHGYAESAGDQLPRLEAIPCVKDWTIASVQGLNRFYRGRSQDVVAGWMTREDRDQAIADNVEYVNRVIERIRESFDATGMLVFAGFSQGTAMAYRAAVHGRFTAAAIVAVGGDVPPELLAAPGSVFPPVLIVRGIRDEWYTQAKLDADVTLLRGRGGRVTPIVCDAAHEWSSPVTAHTDEFLRSL
jgi:predicted esterase